MVSIGRWLGYYYSEPLLCSLARVSLADNFGVSESRPV